jgi:hypothetical protein
MLEKSLEIQVALILYCFLLFFDIGLELFDNSGVYELAFGEPNVQFTAALAIKFVVIFVGFSIFISLLMPIIAVLTERLIRPIALPVSWFCWFLLAEDGAIPDTHQMWSAGNVYSSALKKKAHETKEQYYLDLTKKAAQHDSDYQRTTRQFMAAFGLSVYNMLGHFGSLSLLQGISVKSGEYGYVYVWLFICVFLVCSLKLLLRDND